MDTDQPQPHQSVDVMDAADTFMSRLRPPAEEDVPLLTEVVESGAIHTPAPTDNPFPPITAETQAALQQTLEEWLDMHLTEAILKVLDGIADQLVARVALEAREDLLPKLQATLQQRIQDS